MFTCYQSSEVAWEGSLLKTRESVDSYTKTNIYKYVKDLVKLQQTNKENWAYFTREKKPFPVFEKMTTITEI